MAIAGAGRLLSAPSELFKALSQIAIRPRSPAMNGHPHDHAHGHGHSHGMVDASITTSERGMWAIKWSFAGLAATAALQAIVVLFSGSVALLADTIHNFADAGTAIPLAVAFWFGRK